MSHIGGVSVNAKLTKKIDFTGTFFAKIYGVSPRVSWCDAPLCYFCSRKRLEYVWTEKIISTIIEQEN